MMSNKEIQSSLEDEAAEIFVARLNGDWRTTDDTALKARLAADPAFAGAFRRIEGSWHSLAAHAESPELMRYREEALTYARHTSGRRWLRSGPYIRARHRAVVAVAVAALAIIGVYQLSTAPWRGEEYRTALGEQRVVELADHSRIALDSATRIRVQFSGDARVVDLKEGQAQFTVAHDLARPFKVRAGNQTIIALGTIFMVEYVDRRVQVAMVEGRVAVVATSETAPSSGADAGSRTTSRRENRSARPESPAGTDAPATSRSLRLAAGEGAIELSAGEALKVDERAGGAVVVPKADLEAATAWRSGKLIFRSETLDAAIRRVNRYSRRQIAIADTSLGERQISGVFDEGDTQGFVNALQQYLPIAADYSDSIITLKSR